MLEVSLGLLLGILAATFSSSIFFRLPRGINLHGFLDPKLKPFCSKCKHYLKFYEYYSVISWITCHNKCSYCGDKIDKSYMILESFIILSSILNSHYFGIGEQYIINIFITILASSICTISLTDQKIPGSLYLSLLFLAILNSSYFHLELLDVLWNIGIAAFFVMLVVKFLDKSRSYIDFIIVSSIAFVYLGGLKLYAKFILTTLAIIVIVRLFQYFRVIKMAPGPKIWLVSVNIGWFITSFI